MRINKYIASSGVCSRRKADDLIEEGRVAVNGSVMTSPGYDVSDDDRITVDGDLIRPEKRKVCYALNKPVGIVTTASDEQGRPAVLDFFDDVTERVFPVGRLDMNTSGLIFVTNDGELADRIMHPGAGIGKVYRVRIKGSIPMSKVALLRKGVDIGGYVTGKAQVDVIEAGKRSTLLEVTIHEGRNRQIRRMFKSVGCPVQELTRIAIGNIKLGHLKPGQYRKLTASELEYLRRSGQQNT